MPLGPNERETRFEQWLADYAGLLLKVVRSFAAAPSDYDDLLQEILLQVWISLPNFRDESKPTTWLYRVALNTALVWKRSEKKHRSGATAVHVLPDVPADAADDKESRETIEQLYAAIRSLEPAKRSLVLLYLDGLSYSEMAEVLGISESNVGVTLNRAKKALSALMNGRPHGT